MDIQQRITDKEQISLYHADCMECFKSMPDNSVTLTLTDIPYAVLNDLKGTKRERYAGALRKHTKDEADELNFDLNIFVDEICRITSGSCYVFCSTEQVSELRARFIHNGLSTRLGIWEKTNPAPSNGEHLWLSGIETCVFARKSKATFNEHCKNSVWRFPSGGSKDHPTQKPLELFKYLTKVSSNKDDLVMDCCMGSGTAGVAAMELDRRFLGMETNKLWFDFAHNRICRSIEAHERKQERFI